MVIARPSPEIDSYVSSPRTSRKWAIAASNLGCHASVMGLNAKPAIVPLLRSVRHSRTSARSSPECHKSGWCCQSRGDRGSPRSYSRARPAGRHGRFLIAREPAPDRSGEAVAAVSGDLHPPPQATSRARPGRRYERDEAAIGEARIREQIRVISGFGGVDQTGRHGHRVFQGNRRLSARRRHPA